MELAPVGMKLAREKRLAIANCNGLLIRACDDLDDLMGRGASSGIDVESAEDLGPMAMRVIELRRRRRRLQAELDAISGEWSV